LASRGSGSLRGSTRLTDEEGSSLIDDDIRDDWLRWRLDRLEVRLEKLELVVRQIYKRMK
jgi:hypothetical protein